MGEPGGSPSTEALSKKELGQHFLVDENILGVIGRLADLQEEDVVLEIGPGLGVLTTYLADRVQQVYTVEVDTSLGPRLTERLAGRPNVELRFGDALRLDLAEAAPGAKKLVANLPYNIATPLIVESLDRLPELELWCVMVQREVADRLFAEPSTKAYGAVSVLVQLVAERGGFHPVSRTVFRPRPNVESALVAFRRTGLPDNFRRIKGVVEAAFAHRRKRLANSLELAGLTDRERAEEAIARIGRPPTVRAEELAPTDFVELAEALA
jgi:16S rRNA (adenine1518-N6/adenine1519-N6)-dimethyltransferase